MIVHKLVMLFSFFIDVYCCFETGPVSVAQATLGLIVVLLPQPSRYWDYRCETLYLAVTFIMNLKFFDCPVSFRRWKSFSLSC